MEDVMKKTVRLILCLFVLTAFLLLQSCNKDDNTPTQSDSTGSIQGEVTDANSEVINNATVVTNPPTSSVLTDQNGDYTISDVTAGTYTVKASKTGFSDDSVNVSVVASKTTTANIQLTAAFVCGSEIQYSGKTYNTVLIGNQCWLKENLDVGIRINGSQNQTDNGTIEKYCYNNDPSNCSTYGGLYQWDEMMQYTTQERTRGICPEGWHIPTDAEWKILEGTVDSQYGVGDQIWNNTGYRGTDVGKRLKSTYGWKSGGNGNNLYGFGALPGGRVDRYGAFLNASESAHWWSSTESSSSYAWLRNLNYDHDQSYRIGNHYKADGRSVRCLKD